MSMPSDPFADMRSCLARLQQTSAFLPAMDKIRHTINDPVIMINGKDIPFDEDSLFASLGVGEFRVCSFARDLFIKCRVWMLL